MASHRSAEPGSLVVCVSFEDRDALIAEAPEIYYVKEHYLNYEPVLVRLSRINQTGDYDRARGLAGFLDRQRFFALELTNLCAMP